jgi:hypothetical protein
MNDSGPNKAIAAIGIGIKAVSPPRYPKSFQKAGIRKDT